MHSGLVFWLVACHFATVALTAPYEPIILQTRNSNATQSSPSIITSRILSANGTDVSSSFRTLVYYQSPSSDDTVTKSNLTDRQVGSGRRIDHCRAFGAEFIGSMCTHSQGLDLSLRAYTIHCKMTPIPMYNYNPFEEWNQTVPNLEPRYFAENGACADHEICVNEMPHERRQTYVATCVNTYDFIPDAGNGGRIIHGAEGQGGSSEQPEGGSSGQYIGDALRAIGAKKAGVIVSQSDGSRAVGLNSLEVDVGAQHDGAGGTETVEQRQKCKDCFGLRTKVAPDDANFMKIEATLMATAALTGVVWVSVFAG